MSEQVVEADLPPSNGRLDRASFVLTDEQWHQIAGILPARRRTGRPRTVNLRIVVEGILSVERQGLKWRDLASRYPNAPAIRYYFDHWTTDGTWQQVRAIIGQQPANNYRH